MMVVVIILIAHAAMLLYGAWWHSPVHAEVQQLPAGLSHLAFGTFDLADVNPPLVRLVAAVPVWALSPGTDWSCYGSARFARAEYSVGEDFIRENGPRSQLLFFAGRCACIPFSLLGAYFCYRWSRELYGAVAGVASLLLWCTLPSVMGHAQFISADIAGASLAVVYAYCAWRWFVNPSILRATYMGGALGLGLSCKFTLLLMIPLTAVGACLWVMVSVRRRVGGGRIMAVATQMAYAFMLSLFIVNTVYGFEGTPVVIKDQAYRSQVLKSLCSRGDGMDSWSGMRQWLGALPVPLPKGYLRGLDVQKLDFEAGAPCFLNQVWKQKGWWYFYLFAFVIKTPIGVLVLFCAGVAKCLWHFLARNQRGNVVCAEVLMLAIMAAVMGMVGWNSGQTHHFRYAFPVLGFVCIFASRCACWINRHSIHAGKCVVAAITWAIVGSFGYYPHGASYYNEFIGGPEYGHQHLHHSNNDWGQDLYYVKQWQDANRDCLPFFLACDAGYSPRFLGLDYQRPPKLFLEHRPEGSMERSAPPAPGWYAIGVNQMHSYEGGYEYFLEMKPVALCNLSIRIFHVTKDDSNRLRRRMGIPELPDDWLDQQRQKDTFRQQVITGFTPESTDASAMRVQRIGVLRTQGREIDEKVQNEIDDKVRSIWNDDATTRIEVLKMQDVTLERLRRLDALIVPGGNSRSMIHALGVEGRQSICRYVEEGGGYVGICAGSFLAASQREGSLGLLNATVLDGEIVDPRLGPRSLAERGSGKVAVEFADAGKTILGDPGRIVKMIYGGGPVWTPADDAEVSYVALAYFRTEVNEFEAQIGTMIETPAVIASFRGKGRVLLFSPHPETTPTLRDVVRRAVSAVARRLPESEARTGS